MINNILTALREMVNFASIYCFSKCMKTLLCGVCLIPVILLVHKLVRRRSAILSCYLWLLLVPMAFMGMSKLFYQKYFVYITMVLFKYVKTWHGCIYFGVMFLLLANFIFRTVRLRRRLRRLPQINNASVINYSTENIRIYLSETNESPFSGGIFKPYIVVPRDIWEGLDKRSRDIILCHELTHIKAGHIILLTVFKLLTMFWWINPLIYICEAMLKEDIELACDECTIAAAGTTGHEYGCVLFGMIEHLGTDTGIAAASFVGGKDFTALKKRIQYFGSRATDRLSVLRQVCVGALTALTIVLLVCGFIAATSYPRYTILEELYVYNEDMSLIGCNTPDICAAFQLEEGVLHIDEEGFEAFLREESISGDYVYVSFGAVMKLPGVGGCGDVVMINVEDMHDTLNLAADTVENRLLELFLKYVI